MSGEPFPWPSGRAVGIRTLPAHKAVPRRYGDSVVGSFLVCARCGEHPDHIIHRLRERWHRSLFTQHAWSASPAYRKETTP